MRCMIKVIKVNNCLLNVIYRMILNSLLICCSWLLLTHLIVAQNLVFYLFRGEPEENFNTEHSVLFEKLCKLACYLADYCFHFTWVCLKLPLENCMRPIFLYSAHQGVICLIFLNEIVEDWQRFNLEEDPSLLGLSYNPPEECNTVLNQTRILTELLLILQNVDIFWDDVVVNQDGELRHKVKASFTILFLLLIFVKLSIVWKVNIFLILFEIVIVDVEFSILSGLLLILLDLPFSLSLDG